MSTFFVETAEVPPLAVIGIGELDPGRIRNYGQLRIRGTPFGSPSRVRNINTINFLWKTSSDARHKGENFHSADSLSSPFDSPGQTMDTIALSSTSPHLSRSQCATVAFVLALSWVRSMNWVRGGGIVEHKQTSTRVAIHSSFVSVLYYWYYREMAASWRWFIDIPYCFSSRLGQGEQGRSSCCGQTMEVTPNRCSMNSIVLKWVFADHYGSFCEPYQCAIMKWWRLIKVTSLAYICSWQFLAKNFRGTLQILWVSRRPPRSRPYNPFPCTNLTYIKHSSNTQKCLPFLPDI